MRELKDLALYLLPVAIVATVLAAHGCASARRSEPVVGHGVALAGADVEHGQRVYMQRCHGCHPSGEAGLGPALNDKPLPAAAIRTQVRRGVGAMPGFNDSEISDEELAALTAYMVALRSHR